MSWHLEHNIRSPKQNNRWTLLFYVHAVAPGIGADLMKRQARERLARINALNMSILSDVGFVSLIASFLPDRLQPDLSDAMHTPSVWFVALC